MTRQYENLFEPGTIGGLDVRNRVVLPAMGTNYAGERGEVTDQLLDYYAARAKGGVGLAIVEVAGVDHPRSTAIARQLRIDDDRFVPGLSRLARRIQDHGARAFVQLHHAGGETTPAKTGDEQPVVPSRVERAYRSRDPRVLETGEVETLVEKFVAGARRAQRAGFDGVELHGAHGYLISQFISPRTNRRDDRYGGGLEDRMTFPLEIVEGIRDRLGESFGISVRISADEFVEGGHGIEASKQVATLLEDSGVDVVNVSAGTYGSGPKIIDPMSYEEGWKTYLAEAISEVVDIPTIAVGVIRHPEAANDVVANGVADFVAIGRGHIADPHIARKAKAGRADEINRCISCNIGCLGEGTFADKPMGCTVNPTVGREREFATLDAATESKEVLVVGAGPAGIEAAIWSDERGHDVTILDESTEPGGQLKIAASPPGKDKLEWFRSYLETELDQRSIDLRLGERVDADDVRDENPDAVVAATGARPIRPDIPGVDQDHVVQAWPVLQNETPPADHVVVIGGGDAGCDTAEYVAENGGTATIIEALDRLAPDRETMSRIDMMERFDRNDDIHWHTGTNVTAIEGDGVTVVNGEGSESFLPANTVVLAVGHVPNDGLARALREDPIAVYLVGDARESRNVYHATLDGTEAGLSIGAEDPNFSPMF